MSKDSSKGLLFVQQKSEQDHTLDGILTGILAWGAAAVLLDTVAVLLDVPASSHMALLLSSGIFCTVYGILLCFRKTVWWLSISIALLVAGCILLQAQLMEGLRLYWNRIAGAWVAGTGWMVPSLKTTMEGGQSICLVTFSALWGSILAIACCLMARRASALLAIMVGAALLIISVAFHWSLPDWHIMFSILMFLALLVHSGTLRRNGWLCSAIAILLIAGILFGLIFAVSNSGIAAKGETFPKVLHKTIHEKQFETSRSTLPEGDFAHYQAHRSTDGTALFVTMEQPELLYMRGFTGSEFTGMRWLPLSNQKLAAERDVLYWLNLYAFRSNSQLEAAASQDAERALVTIENVGACSYYRYVPFTLCTDDSVPAENLKLDGVEANGARFLQYWALTNGEQLLRQTLSVLEENSGKTYEYRRQEKAYRDIIEKYYTFVPESVKTMLSPYWDRMAQQYGGADQMSAEQAQACVLEFLHWCFPEDGMPPQIELPLGGLSGSSYQYTTVAVMTLRYFGIPARYAEGYVISEDMAAQARPGEAIAVGCDCGRAWPEIYQEGIGWIPMRFATGFGEDEAPQKTQDTQITQTVLTPETPVPNPVPDGGSMVRFRQNAIGLWIMILLLPLGLVMVILIRRQIIQRNRQRLFSQENIRDAIACAIVNTMELLSHMGYRRGNASLRTLIAPVEQHCGEIFAGAFSAALDLNDIALFSSQDMIQTQRKQVLDFRDAVIQELQGQIKWYKRFWLRWVRCLY